MVAGATVNGWWLWTSRAGRQCAPAALILRFKAAPQLHRRRHCWRARRVQRFRGSVPWSVQAFLHALTRGTGYSDADSCALFRGYACATTTDSPFMSETWSLSM
jgi:hypothetical protein